MMILLSPNIYSKLTSQSHLKGQVADACKLTYGYKDNHEQVLSKPAERRKYSQKREKF